MRGFRLQPGSRCGTATAGGTAQEKDQSKSGVWDRTQSFSSRRLYPRPVAEGQHQGNQSGLQVSQSCQVIGGQTGHLVPCSHFTEQAAEDTSSIVEKPSLRITVLTDSSCYSSTWMRSK